MNCSGIHRPFSFFLSFAFFVLPLHAQEFEFLADHTTNSGNVDLRISIREATITNGNRYHITINTGGGNLTYSIENLDTQTTVLTSQNMSRPSQFDGLQAEFLFPPSQLADIQEVRFRGNAVEPPVHVFRPGDLEGEGGVNSTGEYTFVGGAGNGSIANVTRFQSNMLAFDYELRFDGNAQGRNKLIDLLGNGMADAPFSLWNIGRGTPSDPGDDYQIVALGFDDSGNPAAYDGGATPADGGPGTMFDRIYFYEINRNAGPSADLDGDGDIDYDDVLRDISDNGDISSDILSRLYLGPQVISRLSMVSLNSDPAYTPPAGTVVRITSAKPISSADVYEFIAPKFALLVQERLLDFQTVAIGERESLDLSLQNLSSSTIDVQAITSDAAQFTASPGTLSIPASGTATVQITFTPTEILTKRGTISIISDDPFFPEYKIQAQGKGTRGSISQLSRTDIQGGVTDVWGYVASDQTEYALVGSSSGITIVKAQNRDDPEIVATRTDVPGFDLKVWGNYVYSVDGSSGAGNADTGGKILDISDPANPQLVGSFPTSHNIAISENGFLYSECAGLRIFDLNLEPTAPAFLWQDNSSECHDASVIGNLLYDFHGRDGVTNIYDVSNPATPQFLSAVGGPTIAYNHSGYPTEDGNYLFICDELADSQGVPNDLTVWDISDLSNPSQVWAFSDPDATIHNLYIIGHYAYVSYYTAGFRIFDISEPTKPFLFDEFDTSPETGSGFAGAFGVYPFTPSGNIYLSDGGTGLHVFAFDSLVSSVETPAVATPSEFALLQNYPNPFNPETVITYNVAEHMEVTLNVYNIVGQKIKNLVNEKIAPGTQAAKWDGTDESGRQVASGVYFYRIQAGRFVQTKRMLLLR